MSVMGDFLARQNEEVRKKAQGAINNASDELGSVPISQPGNYLCEVASFAYKDKKKNNAVRVFPELYVSEEKGSLNLNISLKVVDGTGKVPKGASIYKNITLMPGAVGGQAPSDDTIAKVMRFTKPLLVTLTGTNKIDLTDEWVSEWLLPEFAEEGNKLVMKKDHKMKNQVMVLVDHQLGSDQKIRLNVKNIVKAMPGDKSETFLPTVSPAAQTAATTPAPNFDSLTEAGDGDIPAHVPDVEEFQ